MANPIQPGDVLRCTQKAVYANSDAVQNVYYYKHMGASSVAAATVAGALEGEISGWTGFITPYQSPDLVYDGVDIYNVTQDEPIDFVPDSYSNVGTVSGEILPTQCAALVSFPTGVKRGAGRKFLGALGESASEGGGDITTALATALGNWAAAVLGGVSISGNTFSPGHIRKATGVFLPWAAAAIDTIIRTQRRRVRGVGA